MHILLGHSRGERKEIVSRFSDRITCFRKALPRQAGSNDFGLYLTSDRIHRINRIFVGLRRFLTPALDLVQQLFQSLALGVSGGEVEEAPDVGGRPLSVVQVVDVDRGKVEMG